eukprot:3043831-Prymnesium_polylepis.1
MAIAREERPRSMETWSFFFMRSSSCGTRGGVGGDADHGCGGYGRAYAMCRDGVHRRACHRHGGGARRR